MRKINEIICDIDGSDGCEFVLSTEDGNVYIDAEGNITFSYGDEDDIGKNIVDFMKENGINKENLEKIDVIDGSCGKCEDFASVTVHFEDGTVMPANDESFIYAFM